ncbi:uncharacterized protein LOC141723516 [Apium graveolens]|uniref:uncharacterized protein LOC141723516 n=1 Tax=Apium graveolens TaxID=4045 RepID=UPI003D78E7BA
MQQPNAQMQPKAVGEWTTPLWGCFSDWGNCITTLFCPCVTYGQVANIVDQGKTSCFSAGKTYAMLMYFTCGCCMYSCFSRSKLRFMYNLPPNPFGCADCVVHTCCEPCALCQEYRELQNRGYNMSIGWDLNKTVVGTVAPMSQVMTQIDNTSNHPNDRQNNRYDNQQNRQNDSYNNQIINRRQNDAPLSQVTGQMDINSLDLQNDRYDNQDSRPNDQYDNQNNRQNNSYNNQNMNRRQNDAPLSQMMDQMDINPNDLQTDRYDNQNNRPNNLYDNRNNRQNDPYNNQNMNRRQNDAPLNQMMDQMDINPNDRQNDRHNNQNLNRQSDRYDNQNNRQTDQPEDHQNDQEY